MIHFELPENVTIFLDNLCPYHVCFDLISFFMVLFTWWFCKTRDTVSKPSNEKLTRKNDLNEPELFLTKDDFSGTKGDTEDDYNSNMQDHNLISNLKIMRQKAIIKELQAKLTKDELEEEKRMQKVQLEKIFQLLQDQEDRFQVSSMEQLHEQLNLYSI